VAQVWEAPIERNRYERQWMQTAGHCRARLRAARARLGRCAGLFAMEYVDHPVWKNLLREGRAHPAFAAKVGTSLAAIHAATRQARCRERIPDGRDLLRHPPRALPGRYRNRQPDLADTLQRLAQRTAASKRCLVHGDVSP